MDMDVFMLIFGCIFAVGATVGLGFILMLLRRERDSDH